jgi:crotonobetainyl-CoA:carnitine CoA-transferase CaiB-like acyl-CoA transferase
MNPHQKQVYDSISRATALATPADKIQIDQTPTYLKEPVKVADFAAAVVAGFGANVAELGQVRGLPAQGVAVDRRHATLSLNSAVYHYMNGVAIRGGEIEVPVNGFFETRDGKWVCFNGAFPHLRDGILKYFDAPHDQARLIAQVAKHDLAKIEADFEKLRLCAAPLFTHEQWLQHPQGQALQSQPVVGLERFGEAKKRVLPEAKHRPMEGVRVIDVTHVVAGPWLTRLLADQGADVISVRNANFPFLYPVIFEESYGKKQIVLDLRPKAAKERARFVELLKDADVLVWGYGPGSLDRLGFDRATLQQLNPNLVVTFLSAYGPKGPWANRKGWEQLGQTCSGAVDLVSRGRDQKHLIAALPLDYGTGYLGAAGTLAALRHRQQQGGFWVVNAALCRTAMELLALPHQAENAVPVSIEEMGKYLADQDTPSGTVFTRIAPAARLSKTPSYSATGPAVIGAHDPFLTGWDTKVTANGEPKHRPSEILKRGLLGFVPGYGHEDIMLREA